MGQIQKVLFMRLKNDLGALNGVADPRVLATWTPLLGAVDSTRVVPSPYLQAPASTPGEERTFGGGNETLDGIEISLGSGPSMFEAVMYGRKQQAIEQLKKLKGEKIGVYLFDGDGQIGCIVDDAQDPSVYRPIPIHSLFVSDKGFGNYDGPDTNSIRWKMRPNWSDKFAVLRLLDFTADDLTAPDAGDFNDDFNDDFA
jgi:hypothetical protein